MYFTAPCTPPSDTPHRCKFTLDDYLLPSQPTSHSSSVTRSGLTQGPEAHYSVYCITCLLIDLETISLSLGSLDRKDYANK